MCFLKFRSNSSSFTLLWNLTMQKGGILEQKCTAVSIFISSAILVMLFNMQVTSE